jgi:uncharacterized protein YhbP (UPF0306 family)
MKMATEVFELVKGYLQQCQIMQLATAAGDQPWICNVHYVADETNTLYWVSSLKRRHSQEIHENSKAAAAVAVKFPKHPVVGIQIEGDAKVLDDPAELEKALKLYDQRYVISKEFYSAILGTAGPRMYKLVPRVLVLFDEENFPDDSRQEIKIEA